MSKAQVEDSDVDLPDYNMEDLMDEVMDGDEVERMTNSV